MWARRYARQVLCREQDIEHWFFYAALNPVKAGLVASVMQYPGYNSFFDAVAERERKYYWIDWSAYLQKKRYDDSLKPEDFKTEYTLRFSRLPGYEELSSGEYQKEMQKKLISHQSDVAKARRSAGKGFMGVERYKLQKSGSFPFQSKISHRHSRRPLILTLCPEIRSWFLSTYFAIRERYLEASAAFRAGQFDVHFPEGTYPPPVLRAV